MANVQEIKSRISSIGETKKVTDAMYMISSVKMRKAKKEVAKTKPYFRALKEQISTLFKYFPETQNRYFRAPDSKGKHLKHGILLVTSDKGLAGNYNQMKIAKNKLFLLPLIFQTIISSDLKRIERCGIHAALRCRGRGQRSGDLRPAYRQTACGASVCGAILFCSTLLTWK